MQADPKLALFSITHSHFYRSIYEGCKHVCKGFLWLHINIYGNWMGAL
jgi:hypothetical protein